jgi:hypothetical protein
MWRCLWLAAEGEWPVSIANGPIRVGSDDPSGMTSRKPTLGNVSTVKCGSSAPKAICRTFAITRAMASSLTARPAQHISTSWSRVTVRPANRRSTTKTSITRGSTRVSPFADRTRQVDGLTVSPPSGKSSSAARSISEPELSAALMPAFRRWSETNRQKIRKMSGVARHALLIPGRTTSRS